MQPILVTIFLVVLGILVAMVVRRLSTRKDRDAYKFHEILSTAGLIIILIIIGIALKGC